MAEIAFNPTRAMSPRLVGSLLLSPLGALVVLLVFNAVLNPNFFSFGVFSLNLSQFTAVLLVSLGTMLVIGAGGLDLSTGSIMAVAGTVAALIAEGRVFDVGQGEAVYIGFVAAILVGTLIGAINGLIIQRFGIQPIIVTLAMLITCRGLAQVLTNGEVVVLHNRAMTWLGQGTVLGVPAKAVLVVVAALAVAFFLRKTIYGIYLCAIGINEKAAHFAGRPVNLVKIAVYAASGFMASLAGLVVIGLNAAADPNTLGTGIELDAIAAIAIGGTALTGGRVLILGTIGGALVMQLLTYTLIAFGVPNSGAMLVKAIAIAVAVSAYVWSARAR